MPARTEPPAKQKAAAAARSRNGVFFFMVLMGNNSGVIQFFWKCPKYYSGFRDLADARKFRLRAIPLVAQSVLS